jgi:hypothetical protein
MPKWIQKEMTELLWYCPNCKSGNDRMEAVLGRKKYWLFGERKRKLIAICIDCWHEMEFVGTV